MESKLASIEKSFDDHAKDVECNQILIDLQNLKRQGDPYVLSDNGNAWLLAKAFGPNWRYVENAWWIDDGKRWRRDTTGEIGKLAFELPGLIMLSAEGLSAEEKQPYFKWAGESASEFRTRAALQKTRCLLGLDRSAFDSDSYIINIQNGIYVLRKDQMERIPYDPKFYCSQIAGVSYDPTATCPKFMAFLERIMKGNKAMIEYLSRIFGYSLTGDTGQRCFFVLYGLGANGKSTLMNVILRIMGDYGRVASIATFMNKRNGYDEMRDLAPYWDKRLISASESSAQQRINEPLIKSLTGTDGKSARKLYEEAFDYYQKYKIFLHSNFKPIIREQNEAMWSRVRLIKFDAQIPEDERKPNYHEILLEERSGIFNWMLEGLRSYYENGEKLDTPEEVKLATSEYKTESDVISTFIKEYCTTDVNDKCENKKLYNLYTTFCQDHNERYLSHKAFSQELIKLGYKNTKSGAVRNWTRIGILESDDETEVEKTFDGQPVQEIDNLPF